MKEIDLGDLEFVSFVTLTQMSDNRLFGTSSSRYSNIGFLARHQGKIRLFSYRFDPWHIDTEDKDIIHDSIFIFNGLIRHHPFQESEDNDRAPQKKLTEEKIRNVQLLT